MKSKITKDLLKEASRRLVLADQETKSSNQQEAAPPAPEKEIQHLEHTDAAEKFVDVPQALWHKIKKYLPELEDYPEGGRPPLDERIIVAAVIQRLKSGCSWKSLTESYGSGSTAHLRYRKWCTNETAQQILDTMVEFFGSQNLRGLDSDWSCADLTKWLK